MKRVFKSNWLVPACLIALSLIPSMAGFIRIIELNSQAVIHPENSRFFAAPWPVEIHIVSSLIYCIVGAFQFATSFRQGFPRWHRQAGRALVPLGLASAASGLWMTLFYPAAAHHFDGPILTMIRLIVGLCMIIAILKGAISILRRDVKRHKVWMMRAYALGMGAGTQVLTHIPWMVFPEIRGEVSRTISMAAGWFINLLLVEFLVHADAHQVAQKSVKAVPVTTALNARGRGEPDAMARTEGYTS